MKRAYTYSQFLGITHPFMADEGSKGIAGFAVTVCMRLPCIKGLYETGSLADMCQCLTTLMYCMGQKQEKDVLK